MSSVNYNIGFSNQRNSSRVLKPPGGGHTDIFGVKDVQQQKEPEIEVAQSVHDEGANGNEKEPQKTEGVVVTTEENVKPKEDTPKRMRQPPGGFSSGLW